MIPLKTPFQTFLEKHFAALSECRLCPRDCRVDRLSGKKGVCRSDAKFNISSICIHRGEEPAISGENGICNIFFSSCNLSCIYCQNWQISNAREGISQHSISLDEVVNAIIPLLDQGCKAVGFVSPTHFIPHVKAIIDSLRSLGRFPVFVYNTNCYDKAEEVKGLESYIDVYLPDFKYAESGIANDYSSAPDYPEVALAALREMYRQKGSTLILDETGQVESGLIIRHLILPGSIENSIDVLRLIADKLSESVTLSLMAQYWPVPAVKDHPHLGRNITSVEYKRVVDEMEKLGFYKGWVQDLDSHSNYRPDFFNDHPFEI